jgi:hypothetical protein
VHDTVSVFAARSSVSPLFEIVPEDAARKRTLPAKGAAPARGALGVSGEPSTLGSPPRIDRILKDRLRRVGMSASADGAVGGTLACWRVLAIGLGNGLERETPFLHAPSKRSAPPGTAPLRRAFTPSALREPYSCRTRYVEGILRSVRTAIAVAGLEVTWAWTRMWQRNRRRRRS